jgi:hypothetical protein
MKNEKNAVSSSYFKGHMAFWKADESLPYSKKLTVDSLLPSRTSTKSGSSVD